MTWSLFILFFAIAPAITSAEDAPFGPPQPLVGPGSTQYAHDSVRLSSFAEKSDGYWLFEPTYPKPDSAPVVIFIHGYGALNPMAYGGWIRHLVRRGNIVIYPRYQKNLLFPGPGKFDEHIARAIRQAHITLQDTGRVHPQWDQLLMIGHSYGGTMTAYFAARYKAYGLPKPLGIMLCAPGTGPFRSGRLTDYGAIPEDIGMLIISNAQDQVVGQQFQNRIFRTTDASSYRNMLLQKPDSHGLPELSAHHNECYSLDKRFDVGLRNPTIARAYRVGNIDAVDYYGYWKLFDAMASCLRVGQNCTIAFGHTMEQTSLGYWSDGQKIVELEPVKRRDLRSSGD